MKKLKIELRLWKLRLIGLNMLHRKENTMKFKRNFFSTYILIFNTLMIVGITPMLIAIFSILDVEDSPNPISMVGIILVVLLVLDIFFIILGSNQLSATYTDFNHNFN